MLALPLRGECATSVDVQDCAHGALSNFYYGPDRELIVQLEMGASGSATRTYIERLFEKVVRSGGTTETRANIYAGDSLVAVVKDASLSTIEWMHTDHLGSTDAITNTVGEVATRMSFDAWGRRRNPNGTDAGMYAFAFQGGLGAAPSQGFTGHKSLDHLELVHMGGRMYDPVLGRFLSPDPYVQFPESTQGFNRYTYVNNNPLSYVDPSGFWSLKKAFKSIGKWFKRAFKKVGQWYERLGKKYLTVLVTATIAIAAPPLLPYAVTIASGVQTAINGGSMDQVFISAAIALASYHVMGAIHDKIASILEQNGGCFGTGTGGGTLSFNERDGKQKNSGEDQGEVSQRSSQSGTSTRWYDVNPVKLSVGAASVVQGSFAMVGGAGIAAVGEGALLTTPLTGPVGAVSGTAATALGTAKFTFGYGRFRRGRQQMWEAADEGLGDASLKNLLGWLPSGQRYDDPGEPTFGQYWSGLYDRARYDFWGTAREAIRDFFAFPQGDDR